jgi:hypothetical protein
LVVEEGGSESHPGHGDRGHHSRSRSRQLAQYLWKKRRHSPGRPPRALLRAHTSSGALCWSQDLWCRAGHKTRARLDNRGRAWTAITQRSSYGTVICRPIENGRCGKKIRLLVILRGPLCQGPDLGPGKRDSRAGRGGPARNRRDTGQNHKP